MSKSEMITAIGLMSGTSMDGVDAAILRSDGRNIELLDGFYHHPYSDAFRSKLKLAIDTKEVPDVLERELTEIHADCIKELIQLSSLTNSDISLIGFHGQTISHHPDLGTTRQIGDGKLLSRLVKIDVVNDFRTADMKAGGQGAPLAPLFHQAIARQTDKPVAILNLGGVGNVTYIGDDDLIAFDTGPANALIDDVMYEHTGRRYDDGGKIAAEGNVNQMVLSQWLENEYFKSSAPKSLDRDHFRYLVELMVGEEFEDKVATLTAFTVMSVVKSLDYMPRKPKAWYITGGGIHNQTMIDMLKQELAVPILSIEELGINPDATEALAFAHLAVRSVKGLPLSLPSTTGVKTSSVVGGVFCPA